MSILAEKEKHLDFYTADCYLQLANSASNKTRLTGIIADYFLAIQDKEVLPNFFKFLAAAHKDIQKAIKSLMICLYEPCLLSPEPPNPLEANGQVVQSVRRYRLALTMFTKNCFTKKQLSEVIGILESGPALQTQVSCSGLPSNFFFNYDIRNYTPQNPNTLVNKNNMYSLQDTLLKKCITKNIAPHLVKFKKWFLRHGFVDPKKLRAPSDGFNDKRVTNAILNIIGLAVDDQGGNPLYDKYCPIAPEIRSYIPEGPYPGSVPINIIKWNEANSNFKVVDLHEQLASIVLEGNLQGEQITFTQKKDNIRPIGDSDAFLKPVKRINGNKKNNIGVSQNGKDVDFSGSSAEQLRIKRKPRPVDQPLPLQGDCNEVINKLQSKNIGQDINGRVSESGKGSRAKKKIAKHAEGNANENFSEKKKRKNSRSRNPSANAKHDTAEPVPDIPGQRGSKQPKKNKQPSGPKPTAKLDCNPKQANSRHSSLQARQRGSPKMTCPRTSVQPNG